MCAKWSEVLLAVHNFKGTLNNILHFKQFNFQMNPEEEFLPSTPKSVI